MIKWAFWAGGIVAGFAFAAGCYVGWKTTMKVVDNYDERKKAQRAAERN